MREIALERGNHMSGEEILALMHPEIFIVIPVLMIIGLMLKATEKVKDWTIPIILGIVGMVFSILILGFGSGFTAINILNGIMQGILAAGMAVYVHQLTIQSTRKRK